MAHRMVNNVTSAINICGRTFCGGVRINSATLWEEYLSGKQTYKQLAKKYNCSSKTIQRKLDQYIISNRKPTPRRVVVMDTNYFGIALGVMLFKDVYTKDNLLKYYLKYETNSLYEQGIKELIEQGLDIKSIVCDGRKGLVQRFKTIPIQMCQFHQVAIIRRYITKNPKLPASKELKELVAMLKCTDKESFEGGLNDWYNAIDGHFSDLKNKLLNHNDLSIKT